MNRLVHFVTSFLPYHFTYISKYIVYSRTMYFLQFSNGFVICLA